MLLVSVLFHLFPLWVWANNIPTRRLDLNSRFCSARISSQCYPLSRSRLHFFFSAIRHFFFHSACSFFPIHPFSLSFCFGFFFVLLASIWMQPASASRNLYNFTYINRVWWSGVKNKNEKPEFSVRCNFSWFRIRFSPYLCVYLLIHVAALCTEYWTVIHVCQMLLLCTHKPTDI